MNFNDEKIVFFQNLNKFQKEAVLKALNKDLVLIHGPFGTGKTTVLVEIILQLSKKGYKILVSADSNTAVDNLLERLIKYENNVVRIGNPTRIDKRLIEHSLDKRIENNELFPKLKKIKEEMEKSLKKRNKFLKPIPSLRRGLKDEDILRYAFIGKSVRNIGLNKIKSMAEWIKANKIYEEKKKDYEFYHSLLLKKTLENVNIILTTSSSSALEILDNLTFDYLIFDEASQATEPSVLIPLIKSKRLVLSGDHKQLPPTVLSEDENLKYSLFERLIDLGKERVLLKIQYRMNEKLMKFPNKMFYNSSLIADDSVRNIKISDITKKGKKEIKYLLKKEDLSFINNYFNFEDLIYILGDKELIFIDTSYVENKEKMKANKSKFNLLEVEIIKIISLLVSKLLDKENFAIISPYKEQVKKLKENIEGVEINSVDAFQGKEKDLVILSLVRSNEKQEIGFLKDYRRLNVAITRAKRKLIIVGNKDTLSSDRIYNKLIDFIKKEGKLITLKSKK